MNKILVLFLVITMAACNDSKTSEPKTSDTPIAKKETAPVQTTTTTATTTSSTATKVVYTVDGKEIQSGGSALVSKDKEKLKPGADWFCMLNATSGQDESKLTLNFLFDLKPGTYPIVGTSLLRKDNGNNQMFGGILGGKAKLTGSNVNLTEVTDLGSNNAGGHKWRISGTFDEITIPAMGVMLMDKTKNHPKEIKVEKGSFANVTFDDNTDELLKKAFQNMKTK